jgi:hypothetical protein
VSDTKQLDLFTAGLISAATRHPSGGAGVESIEVKSMAVDNGRWLNFPSFL